MKDDLEAFIPTRSPRLQNRGKDRKPPPYSGEWLRQRSDDELQYLIDGNMAGGAAHDGARAELDRRENRKDQAAQLRWIKLTFWVTIILGISAIAVTVAPSLILIGKLIG